MLYRVESGLDGSRRLVAVRPDGLADRDLGHDRVGPQYAVSPDGSTAVFADDPDQDGHHDLWAAFLADGSQVELSRSREDVSLYGFQISPDSSTVVYDNDASPHELWSVPLSGATAPVRVSGPLVPGGSVWVPWEISRDGSRGVYVADQETDGKLELWSAPISGGASLKLNLPLPAGASVLDFALHPDGSRVVYQTGDPSSGVYVVPLGGGASLQLAGAASSFNLCPDGSWVLYWAGTYPALDLYSVPVSGGAPVLLATSAGSATASADCSTVVYRTSQAAGRQLRAVPIGGGASVRLDDPLPAGLVPGSYGFSITPDGTRVVYEVYLQGSGTMAGVYGVSVTGGAPVLLASGSVTYELTADSTSMVYTAGWAGLLIVPVAGGTSVDLSGSIAGVYEFRLARDGQAVYFSGFPSRYHRRLVPDTDGDGVLDDCDVCPGLADPWQTDQDGDDAGAVCDCDDLDPARRPENVESNDGLDNQCPGEDGYGAADETSGATGFRSSTDRN